MLREVIETTAEAARGMGGYAKFEPDGDGPISEREALEGINKIRNSIVGLQSINWSEHIYPLVSLLNRAGIEGLPYPEAKANYGTCLAQRDEAVALLKRVTERWNSGVPEKVEIDALLARIDP